jgi:type II secretory pathway component PulK
MKKTGRYFFLGRAGARRGSVLVTAAWALFLLAVFAVQLGAIARQKVTLVRRVDTREQRYYIAAAGVKRAVVQLRREDSLFEADFLGESWSDQPDAFENISLGRGKFTVGYEYNDGGSRVRFGLQDEESKINLNKAGVDVIARLLEIAAGLSYARAEELAYCIIDWRDPDSVFGHPQYGAEDADYEDLSSPYQSKDGDFEVYEELLLVDKMDQGTFDKIQRYITIYGAGRVNINTASKEVLSALGLTERVAEDIITFRNGPDRLPGTADDDIFLQAATIVPRLSQAFSLGPSDVAALSNMVAGGQFQVNSEYFRIDSAAELSGLKGKTAIVAVADRTGKVVYWHEEI